MRKLISLAAISLCAFTVAMAADAPTGTTTPPTPAPSTELTQAKIDSLRTVWESWLTKEMKTGMLKMKANDLLLDSLSKAAKTDPSLQVKVDSLRTAFAAAAQARETMLISKIPTAVRAAVVARFLEIKQKMTERKARLEERK